MSSEIAIEVKNLSKCYQIYDQPHDRLKQFVFPLLWRTLGLSPKQYYREFWALNNVSFEVKKGTTIGIIGRNGSGKSTLLQMICGTLNPSYGCIKARGRIAALLELGSGFNPEFTGRENVYLSAALLGLSLEEINAKYEGITTFADIGHFIDQPIKTYSSGMVVRLAFAVASCIDPEILIIDEALAVGDAIFQSKCFRRFKELQKLGCTVVLVTHDVGAVVQLCTSALVLHNGELVASGPPKEMCDVYRRLCAEDTLSHRLISASEQKTHPQEETVNNSEYWLSRSPQTQEYGDRRSIIDQFAILNAHGEVTTCLSSGEFVFIRMKLIFLESCAAPIAAFGIRDLSGMELCGSNTWYEGEEIGFVEKGHTVTVNFKFRLLLQSGIYNLTMACTELSADGIVVMHRLFDVAVFEVSSARKFVGRFDAKPSVQVCKTLG